MKKKILGVGLFIIQIILIFIFGINNVFAQSKDEMLNDKELYDATNNHNYSYQNSNYAKDEARYDLSYNNGNIVDDSEPLITVFTHGVGGGAFNWSNDGTSNTFSYSKYSLITRMANMINSNVYYVRFESGSMNIRNITYNLYENINGKFSNLISQNGKGIDHITDISKHSIIVFESSKNAAYGLNDEVYTEFNYAISKIVLDIKKLNNDKLPRMNLIGHSRGGITNMQYALDHPDLVASMYTLGTPFTGTTTASFDYVWNNGQFTGNEEVARELVSEDVYMKYMTRWNENYDLLYKNINVIAFGTYESYYAIREFLLDEAFIQNLEDLNKITIDRNTYYKVAPIVIDTIAYFIVKNGVENLASIRKNICNIISSFFSSNNELETAIDDLLIIINRELKFIPVYPYMIWNSDVLVNLNSQLGYKNVDMIGSCYRGFKRITKCLFPNNTNLDAAASPNAIKVGHNLETMDLELGKYILNDIKLGMNINKDYLCIKTDNENGIIDTYLGQDSHVNIPEYVNGIKIIGINDSAFANSQIEDVIIPKDVTFIGLNAFANCSNLKSVNLGANSNLNKISSGAFYECKSLTSLKIPSSLATLGDNAFLDSNVSNIDVENNSNYRFEKGLLIDNRTKSIIYASPRLIDVKVPDGVDSIDNYVFSSHQNIKTIDLNSITSIGSYAFYKSTLESVFSGKVNYVGGNAFEGTSYIENDDSDFKKIGSVLINCNSNMETTIIPNDVKCISCGFKENVKNIILPEAFESFNNIIMDGLDSILLTGNNIPYLGGYIFDESIKIYVNENSYPLYKKDDIFTNSFYLYKNNVSLKDINITFYDENKNVIDIKTEQYGSLFDNFVEPPKKSGYVFKHYIDEKGNIYEKNKTLNSYLNLNLYLLYEKAIYTVMVDGEEVSYTLDDFQKVEKQGYDFLGWYTKKNGGTRIDDIIKYMDEHENATVFKHYQIIDYNIYLNINNKKINLMFNAENPVRVANLNEMDIIRFGYVFSGWYLEDGKEFKTTENNYEDLYITARWLGEEKKYLPSSYITDSIIIINLINCDINYNYQFYISETVRSVTFIGNGKEYSSIQIIIKERINRLILGLDNITLKNNHSNTKGLNTIDYIGKNYFDFNLAINGKCKVIGGQGHYGVSENGFDGGIGINVPSFYGCAIDNENSKLTVIGGIGGAGGSGYRGNNGADGLNGPSGSFLNPKKGDDGENGKNGNNGYKGGNGNYAIYVSTKSSFAVDKELKFEFIGGAGGKGGDGGNGGAGGKGADDSSGDIFTGVGKPGNGGNAGNGGDGGDGGNGSDATNYEYILSTGGEGGSGGAAGLAGTPGKGGSAGAVGSDGSSGSTGSDGENGSDGEKGTDGKSGRIGLKGLSRKNDKKVFRSRTSIFTKNYVYGDIKTYEMNASVFKSFVNNNNQSQYLNEEVSTTIIACDELNINTKRLRCSYIENQYLVLSAKKANTGTAYLEMDFDSYLCDIEFELGLWSAKEGISSNNSQILFQYKTGNGDWITIDDFMTKNLNTKEDMISYQYDLEQYYTKSIRLIIQVDNPTGNSNKGRVVIDNIKVQK